MNIYNAISNYIMIDNKEKWGLDSRFIQANSEEEAGEIYELLLKQEGKYPTSHSSKKGYAICEIVINTINDIKPETYKLKTKVYMFINPFGVKPSEVYVNHRYIGDVGGTLNQRIECFKDIIKEFEVTELGTSNTAFGNTIKKELNGYNSIIIL